MGVLARFSVNIVLGGESQQGSLSHVLGYSVIAHCIGKPSYLEPISGSMQKPVEGSAWKKIEDMVAIGSFVNQKHVENMSTARKTRLAHPL